MYGVASIVTKLERTCTPPHEEIEEKIDQLDAKMADIIDKIDGCGKAPALTNFLLPTDETASTINIDYVSWYPTWFN